MSIIQNPFEVLDQADHGGLHEFSFIPVSFVADFPPIINDQIIEQNIALSPGRNWYQGYARPTTLQYEEIPEQKKHGLIFRKSVKGIYPYDSVTVTKAFGTLYHVPLLLKITDRRGMRRLLGTPEEPMRFVGTYKSNGIGGFAEFIFSFNGSHRIKSPSLV